MTGDNIVKNQNFKAVGKSQKEPALGLSKGFTLIEILVSVALLTIVILVSTGSFLVAINAQKRMVAEKEASESVNFALEFMSRQMRTAVRDPDGSCTGVSGSRFSAGDSSEIRFVNQYEECVRFFHNGNRVDYEVLAPIPESPTPLIDDAKATVENLQFVVSGQDAGDGEQPRVTIIIRVGGTGERAITANIRLDIQTTVTARAIDS